MTKPLSDLIRGVRPDFDLAWQKGIPHVMPYNDLHEALIPSITSANTLLYRRGWLVQHANGKWSGAVVGDETKVWWVPAKSFPLLPVDLSDEEVTEELVCRTWARLRRLGITWKEMQMVERLRELSDGGRAEVVRLIEGRVE